VFVIVTANTAWSFGTKLLADIATTDGLLGFPEIGPELKFVIVEPVYGLPFMSSGVIVAFV
jgi:hypothetical protein